MTSVVAVTATMGARGVMKRLRGLRRDLYPILLQFSQQTSKSGPSRRPTVFDRFRQSLEDLMNRATPPQERREILHRMRDTLVQAKVGIEEMREALARSKQRLELERRELDTVRRRKGLAANIGDAETVQIAEKYEQMHVERLEVIERKVAAQESELSLAERDVDEMTRELKLASVGATPAAGSPAEAQRMRDAHAEAEQETADGGAAVRDEIDGLGRARARADREADAARKLEELKRRMGK